MNTCTLSLPTLLLSFLFLAACGGSDNELNDDVFKVDGGGNSLTESLKLADFECTNSYDCPKNIGLLAINDLGYGSADGQCSAFLIADDIVATNSHCIPDSLKSNYYTPDCSDYLAIRFQPDSGKKEIFKCKTLLSYSDHLKGALAQDYAFFKIASTGRTPFKIHKNGIKDNQAISLKRVSPSYYFGGRLNTLNCRNIQNSHVHEGASSPWSATAAAVDCQIIEGNSGSPMVDSSGAVVGIAQAFWTDKTQSSVIKELARRGAYYGSFPDHTIFTNLSCVVDPVTKRMNSQLCEAASKVEFGQCLEGEAEARLSKIKIELETWEKDLSPDFVFEIKNVDENQSKSNEAYSDEDKDTLTIFKAEPICAKSSSAKADWKGTKKISTSYKSNMTFKTKYNVDADLKINTESINLKKTDGLSHDIELTFDENKKLWTGEKSFYSKKYSIIKTKISVDLPECSEEMMASGNLKIIIDKSGEEKHIQDIDPASGLSEEEAQKVATCKELGAM